MLKFDEVYCTCTLFLCLRCVHQLNMTAFMSAVVFIHHFFLFTSSSFTKKKRTEDENFFLFKMKCAFLVHMISIDIAHVPFPSSGSPAVNTPRRLLTMVTCVSDSGARLMACACTLVSHSCMSVCAYAALTRYYVMNLPDTTVRLLSSIMSP